jgi:alcohol dehydrogenase (NADP+)
MSTGETSEQFKAFAVFEPKGELKSFNYTPRQLGERDVDVRITHCGICGTDIHIIDSGWRPAIYPGAVSLLFFTPQRQLTAVLL